ncbi:unnamed protein product (macronuclear) [Paramecium tetraurelia]|uniref:Transmembrane protein n=1 Tax=Paramecium tetraurelia TaxID=5888 RepID=A0E668_PARTE|nr:uncharacterized protein GSPATT00003650001 [Paramecium tetraurelia]CAK90785.1 unnamed protein product [Paramecium tetraurelia]|eukprot:XP_001458182.1 hypothetical protein (macronuclear) [Paramecium tetraurelia strain d4-2]
MIRNAIYQLIKTIIPQFMGFNYILQVNKVHLHKEATETLQPYPCFFVSFNNLSVLSLTTSSLFFQNFYVTVDELSLNKLEKRSKNYRLLQLVLNLYQFQCQYMMRQNKYFCILWIQLRQIRKVNQ